MKKIILSLIVASTFAACNSKTDLDTNKDVILVDTTGMYKSNMMTDTGSVIETSTLAPGTQNRTAVANRRTTNTNRATTSPTRSTRSSSGSTASTSNGNTSSSGTNTTTTAPQKRGMSSAAKGAIIGGVGGAVVGGVIKGGKGAVVGGVAGAAGGYIIGRKKDKRTGRAQ